ncbi:E3 ubiquitin-protein ligase TRIM56-like [Acanthaster planci]|uniref:E3 ubiquitin-protein ligase TRIM56-like n=1 Tax=Acanthaster planci TaxID=133434 RepID=A0A8B7ZZE6_ACAPL|nr:E3 ubiquitin-protein ligase TRIM56-like [Acanthaster planci]
MAKAATKSVLGRISQGHLDCPICRCRYTNPKILDCLHTFCLNCLDKLVSGEQQQKQDITCPLCRQPTAIPDQGLQGLSNCFFLKSLVDEFNKQELLLGSNSVPVPTCQQCDEGLEAVARCQDCDENICKSCQEAHGRWKRTKQHRVITVESLMSYSGSPLVEARKVQSKALQCRIHAGYRVCFYCYACEMSICARCAAIDHRTEDHRYGEIGNVVGEFRKDVEEALLSFEECKERFRVANGSIQHARSRLKIMVERACQDISAKEEEEIARIREKSRRLREKVEEIGRERDGKYEEVLSRNREKMDRADQVVETVTELMREAEEDELLDLKPKIMHNLDSQVEVQFEPVPYELSYVGIKCQDVVNDLDLGEIVHEEKWQLKHEFGKKGDGQGDFKGATGVSSLKDGGIAVADTKNQRLTVLTPNGLFKNALTRTEEDALKAPYSVAVTCDDHLLVTDVDKVKVFGSDFQLLHKFAPAKDDREGQLKSYLSGIDVDKNNRVAVADSGRKVISVHNLDGSLITTIPNDLIHGCISFSHNDRLIFTNYHERRLVCVDFTGNKLFDVGTSVGRKSAKPIGVCCDEAGDIYISTHFGQTGGCEIHQYDPKGMFIRRVVRGLFNPFAMTFSPGGDLIVADMHSVKIFHRA